MIVIQYTQFSCFTNQYGVSIPLSSCVALNINYIEHFFAIFTNSDLKDEKSPFWGIKLLELFLINILIFKPLITNYNFTINKRDDNPIYIMTDTVSHTEMNDICENILCKIICNLRP